jgi:IrrE N-terminal-like domain
MTADLARIAEVVADLRRDCGLPADPARRGPVMLDRFYRERNLSHVALPGLTRGAVVAHLLAEGIPIDDLGDPNEKLAGFVFAAGRIGWAFVSASDTLPRQRFTAAHELGHFVLHRAKMGRFWDDTVESVLESADPSETEPMEHEANRFAAELLMPEEVCLARKQELKDKYKCCPRSVLEYRLAAELLVSQQAIRYRLDGLGVDDE